MTPRALLAGAALMLAAALAPLAVAAQDGAPFGAGPFTPAPPDPAQPDPAQPESAAPVAQQPVARAGAALLRGLDKVSGQTTDMMLRVGEAQRYGRLEVRLGECRYPRDDPSSDAYAQLIIDDLSQNVTLFSGWMIASSPALSALDDARYDVWVISCQS